jgi:hypothetical protein
VAVAFDLYSGGTHQSTTQVLINGVTGTPGAIDMGPSGIVLGSNHPLRVNLAYDVTQLTLTEAVTDTVTGAIFQHVYTDLNIPQVVGGSTAYVGFTGGTGGQTSVQDVLSWSGRFLDPDQPVSHFGLSAAQASAGVPVPVTVTALDAFNDVKPDYRGTAHFASSDPQATLPDDYTFSDADAGTHPFVVVLRTAGSQALTVSDTAHGLSSTEDGIAVTPGSAVAFVVQAPASAPAGTPFVVTVVAVDQFGNVASGYGGTVTFSTSDPDLGVVLPANYTFGPADGGVASFTVTLQTTGDQTLTVADTADGTLTGGATVTVL